MKKLQAVLISGLTSLAPLAAETVKFATGVWEPYTGQDLEGKGMVTAIVTAACHASGIDAVYSFFPWKRAEANVESGASFATFPYQEIQEREGQFYFSEIICSSGMELLVHGGNVKTDDFEYAKPEDLKPFRVGIVAGTDAVKFPLQKIGCLIEEVQTSEQNLKKLETGRLDAVIDDRAVLLHALKTLYGSDPAKLSPFRFMKKSFGAASNYRLMVSRRYPHAKELLERFNAGLKKLKATGEYKAILKKFGL
jgi:polar amino acid transport system substrate-binding protein